MDIEITKCSLSRILNTVESMMRPAAREKGLKFEIRKENNIPENIQTDSARLQQCLINLVNNAVKFTENGLICVHVSWEKGSDRSFIRFDIEDTGIGISEEKQKVTPGNMAEQVWD